MPPEEEVSEFCEGDGATVVNIDPEQVFHDVVDLALSFLMEDINNDLFNSLDVDLIIGVDVFGEHVSEFPPEVVLKVLGCSLHWLLIQ